MLLKLLTKLTASRHLIPTYSAQSVKRLDIHQLKKDGVRYLALDLDSTLTSHGSHLIDGQTLQSIKRTGMPIIIATNRLSPVPAAILDALLPVHVQIATASCRKPNACYFRAITTAVKTPPHTICMVGDRLLTDIWGANRYGMTTVWVEPLGKDPWFTRIFFIRSIEKGIVRLIRTK